MSKNAAIRNTCLLAVVVFCFWLGVPAQAAAPTSYSIPCGDTAALSAAIDAANHSAAPDTIHLAPDCVYQFHEAGYVGSLGESALPTITSPLAIYGHGATLLRSTAETTPGFRFINYTATDGTLIIDRLTMQNGNMVNNKGGAIFSTGPTEIRRSAFRGNRANNGGALYLKNVSEIDRSLFTENQAGYAGGAIVLWIEYPTGSDALRVTNSTFTQNSAIDGFAIITNDATVLQHDTIVGNFETFHELPHPAAVTNAATVGIALSNSILFNTTKDCTGLVSDQGGNLQSGVTCGAAEQITDPMLGVLQDNGGPTHTMALIPSSPAIDHGSVDQCMLVDQRGAPRDSLVSCDAGAYETGGMITGQIQVEPEILTAGETATVKITLTNRLGITANGMTLDGLLPDGVAIQETVTSSDACSGVFDLEIGGKNFQLDGGSLGPDQHCSVEFIVVGTLPGQYILHSGFISSDEGGATDLYAEAALVVNAAELQFKNVFLPMILR